MATSRVYSVPFAKQSLSTTSDLFTIVCGATIAGLIHEITLGVEAATSPEEVTVEIIRVTGAYTAGTGGAAITPVALTSTMSASVFTARGYDTTLGTAGTSTVAHADTWQLLNGYQYLPAPEDRLLCNISQWLVVRLLTAFAAAHNVSGAVKFEEVI